MGLIAAFLLPVTLGGLVVSLDAFEWLMRPDVLFREIERFRCTLCWLPNFAFNHLVRTRDREQTYDLSSMRAFINCSEPCKPETVQSFQKTFAPHGLTPGALQVCYGMAEMVFAVTHTTLGTSPLTIHVDRSLFTSRSEIRVVDSAHADRLSFLSCGRPIEGAELRIVPRETQSNRSKWARALESFGLANTPPGGPLVGEIQVSGKFLFNGYFRNNAANETAFDGRWFRSGDMGFLYDGELFVCGRVKEMLIVHGRNYYANDIEEIVNRVDGIKPGRVVAVGFYDPTTASEEAGIIAETTLPGQDDRGALGQTIREHVLSALNLSLRRIEIASEGTLIKTTSGKISREENVKRLGVGVFS
jgi:acyl-CoA synthetase (AMP-forming)/AMP-acid ligase II